MTAFKSKMFVLHAAILAVMLGCDCSARAQWEQCGGPGGGSVMSLASLNRFVFAGTTGGGMFRSTDQGQTWKHVYLDSIDGSIIALAASGSEVIAVRDSFNTLDELFVSLDSGKTWSRPLIMPAPLSWWHGPIIFSGPFLMYGAAGGVYRSSDTGKTWTLERLPVGYVQSLLQANSSIYAGAYPSSIYRSDDSGLTWSRVDTGGMPDSMSIYSIAARGNTIFAAGDFKGSIIVSLDGGITWDSIATPLDYFAPVYGLYWDDTVLLAGADIGVYSTTDEGVKWKLDTVGEVNSFARSDAFVLAASGNWWPTSGGILRSSDAGMTWQKSNAGLRNSEVLALASMGKHLFASISGDGVYRSDDSGTTWVAVNGGLSGRVSGFLSIDNTIFAFSGFTLFRSTNLGQKWDTATRTQVGWPATVIGSSLVSLFRGFLLSSDSGSAWSYRGDFGGSCTLSSVISKGSDLYASTPWEPWSCSADHGTVHRSGDSGFTWIDLYIPSTVNCLAAEGDNVFAVGSGSIYRKGSADSEWSGYSIPASNVIALVSSSENLFVGTGGEFVGLNGTGILNSADLGMSWKNVSEGLTSRSVPYLLVFPPYLFAGTDYAGIWRRPLSEMISPAAVAENERAGDGTLHVYPNPFSQTTTISFTPQTSGYADVSIVNLLGVEVARIFSGELVAGEHTFTWDAGTTGDGCATGVYECLVRMNGRVETLPVLRLR